MCLDSSQSEWERILYDCYSITFFAFVVRENVALHITVIKSTILFHTILLIVHVAWMHNMCVKYVSTILMKVFTMYREYIESVANDEYRCLRVCLYFIDEPNKFIAFYFIHHHTTYVIDFFNHWIAWNQNRQNLIQRRKTWCLFPILWILFSTPLPPIWTQ